MRLYTLSFLAFNAYLVASGLIFYALNGWVVPFWMLFVSGYSLLMATVFREKTTKNSFLAASLAFAVFATIAVQKHIYYNGTAYLYTSDNLGRVATYASGYEILELNGNLIHPQIDKYGLNTYRGEGDAGGLVTQIYSIFALKDSFGNTLPFYYLYYAESRDATISPSETAKILNTGVASAAAGRYFYVQPLRSIGKAPRAALDTAAQKVGKFPHPSDTFILERCFDDPFQWQFFWKIMLVVSFLLFNVLLWLAARKAG